MQSSPDKESSWHLSPHTLITRKHFCPTYQLPFQVHTAIKNRKGWHTKWLLGHVNNVKCKYKLYFIWVFIFFQWNNIWNIFPKSTLTVFIPVLWWRLLFTWSIKHDIAKHNRKGNWKDYNIIVNVLKVGKKNHPQKNPKYGLVRKDLEEMYEVGLNRKWRCAQFESPPQQHGDCFR